MNAELAFLQISGLLAAEVGAVVLIAWLSERFVPSAHWRRTIWQGCVLSVLLVTVLELSGAARAAGELWRGSKGAPPIVTAGPIITAPQTSPGLAVERGNADIPVRVTGEGQVKARNVPARGSGQRALLALACLWILGTGVFLGRLIVSQAMLLVMRHRGSRVEDEGLLRMVQEIAQRLGVHGAVRVCEFPRLKGPIAFGLARKIIGLPPGFEGQHPRAEQEVILAHELAHLAARDNWWQLLAELTVAALWWHPLVWLARRRLHNSSETVADEASLLFENGPPVLAECLLALGKRLDARPGFGWLNIGGQGFRSGLGRRVQRLFALQGAWKPASKVRMTLAKIFCPAALVLGTVFCSGWMSPAAAMKGTEMKNPMWKRSLPAVVLLALLTPEQPAITAEPPARQTNAVSRGEAKAVRAQKGKGAAAVRRKLEQITLDMQADNLPLGAVISLLIDELRKRDPEKEGVNFLLYSSAAAPAPVIDPATGLPIPGAVPEAVDLSAVTVRIMPPLLNVRVINALDAIIRVADYPLRYSIEDYGVIITHAKSRAASNLETRTFAINPPEIFYKGIESAFGIDVPDRASSREAQQQVFQDLFRQLGIDWAAPKSIFYNELTGIVMVRADREDMALITATMQTLGGTPLDPNTWVPPPETVNPTAKVRR